MYRFVLDIINDKPFGFSFGYLAPVVVLHNRITAHGTSGSLGEQDFDLFVGNMAYMRSCIERTARLFAKGSKAGVTGKPAA
jgi:hypothetical protein